MCCVCQFPWWGHPQLCHQCDVTKCAAMHGQPSRAGASGCSPLPPTRQSPASSSSRSRALISTRQSPASSSSRSRAVIFIFLRVSFSRSQLHRGMIYILQNGLIQSFICRVSGNMDTMRLQPQQDPELPVIPRVPTCSFRVSPNPS